MKTINFDNIDDLKNLFGDNTIVMYGASVSGERIWRIFSQHSIIVNYFCDDNYNKWNTSFCGIPVISFDKLREISDEENVVVILTSVFAGPILGRLNKINVEIYEPFELLLGQYFQNSPYKAKLSEAEITNFCKKVKIVSAGMEDKVSERILSKITDVIKNSGEMCYSHFFDVASQEDCYFIEQVLEALPKHPVIIDCGGFTGDLMVALKRHNIEYDKVYSFEVNPQSFKVMEENILNNDLENRFIPVNKGVWNTCGKAHLQWDETEITGGSINNGGEGLLIDTVTIDDFFKDIHYDFIKMDVEGAELNALKGGVLTIKANRPVMAVSIYHSVGDVVDIPLYLFGYLDNYSYFIRHHSFMDSETVLYCIPDERIVH